jgi:hypothetical protein
MCNIQLLLSDRSINGPQPVLCAAKIRLRGHSPIRECVRHLLRELSCNRN